VGGKMIWTKASRLKPPIGIPLYVRYKGEDLNIEIFSKEMLENLVTMQNYEQWKKDNQTDDYHYEFMESKILEFWSFIPVLPPDEIIPHLAELNDQITRIEIRMREMVDELTNIPRINSIQRMIEGLQIQISNIHPDPYQKWHNEDLAKRLEPAPVPLGNAKPPPPQPNKKGNRKKK
jgi:hypothetical protein